MATLLQRLGWGRPHHREPPPSVHFKDQSNAGIPKGITDEIPKGINGQTNHQDGSIELVVSRWDG